MRKAVAMAVAGMMALAGAAERPQIIAHRGGSKEQDQNTLAALRNSYAAGVRGFEIDVRLTKDRRIVLMHDDTIDKLTTGTGRVEEMTAAEIAPVRTRKSGQPLPALEEVLDFIKGAPGAFIQIELKCGKYPEPDRSALCEGAVKRVADRDLADRVVFICFEPQALKKVKELNPRQATCLVSDKVGPQLIKTAREIGAEYLSVQLNNLYRSFVQDAHAAGLKVTAWTVGSEGDARLAIALGTDYVTTDIPAAQLEQRSARP